MNQQGTLRVQSFAQRFTSAVPEVLITVTGPGFSRTFLTDAEGTAPDLAIEAPPQATGRRFLRSIFTSCPPGICGTFRSPSWR